MKIYDVRGIGANLTGSFSGSFNGLFAGTVEGVSATASYVEYTNVANKPTLVSGSSQITYSGLTGIPSGIVSGSAQISEFGIFATTGSNGFNGSQAITGSLTVTGQVVAQTLNVQQVTSSIVYSSGSNIFGNSLDNTQQFTGSLQVSGSSHYLLGNVGIGTTSPVERLHVETSSEYQITWARTGAGKRWAIGTDTAGFYFNNRTDSVLPLYITNSGNVGIGTPNPDSGLTIDATSTSFNALALRDTRAFNQSPEAALAFRTKFNSAGSFGTPAILVAYKDNATDGNQAGGLQIWTNANAGPTERMRITSSGEILVGLTSRVTGLSGFTQLEVSGNEGGITINSNTTTADKYSRLMFTKSGATGNEGLIRYNVNDYHMAFWTNANERMRITSAGNIEIGTSSPSGTKALTIQAGTNGSASLRLKNDAHDWDVNCQTNDRFAIYSHTDSTERLVIMPTSGNVLIGTTDDVGAKLRINTSGTNDLLYLDAGVNTDFAFKIITGANDVLTLRRQHSTLDNLDIMSFGFNGNVGIGTTSPSTHLHVSSATHTKLRVATTGIADASVEIWGYDAGVHIGDPTNESRWAIWNDGISTSSSLKIGSYALGTWYAGDSQVVTITSAGQVQTPKQPAWSVGLSSPQSFSTNVPNTINWNQSSGNDCFIQGDVTLNTGNGRITVPVAGKYMIFASIRTEAVGAAYSTNLNLRKNGTNILRYYVGESVNSAGSFMYVETRPVIISCAANDYIDFYFDSVANDFTLSAVTNTVVRFGGFLMG